MSPGWTFFVEILAALASAVVILDYFGIKPTAQAWSGIMALSQRWKLVIMLFVVTLSLAFSVYGFYKSFHPKIVEKERIVEKVVPQQCPKCEVSGSSKGNQQPHAKSQEHDPTPPAPVVPPSQSAKGNDNGQVGGGITTGPCSNVQVGGSGNNATTHCGSIYPEMSKDQAARLTADVAEFKGRDVVLNYERATTQSYALGDTVAKALSDAGMTVQKADTESDFGDGSAASRPPSGIFLEFGKNNIDLAQAISRSLRASKFTDKKIPASLDKNNPYTMEVYIIP